jgi:CheY-like chemotaxis protein
MRYSVCPGFFSNLLEHAGYEVDSVTTKAEAKVILDVAEHDVLIANDRLPDGQGFDVAVVGEALGAKSFLVNDIRDDSHTISVSPVRHPYQRQPLGEKELTDLLRNIASSEPEWALQERPQCGRDAAPAKSRSRDAASRSPRRVHTPLPSRRSRLQLEIGFA